MMEKRLPRLPAGEEDAECSSYVVDPGNGSSSTPVKSRTAPFDTLVSPRAPTTPGDRQDASVGSGSSSRGSQIVQHPVFALRSGKTRALWNKQSTPPAVPSAPPTPRMYASPTRTIDGEGDAAPNGNGSSKGGMTPEFGAPLHASPSPSSSSGIGVGLAKKRSSSALLSNINKGLTRVGSAMKRSPSILRSSSSMPILQTSDDGASIPSPTPKPRRQASKLGLTKQGSIRRQMEHGSWRGKRVPDEPALAEEDEGETAGVGGEEQGKEAGSKAVAIEVGDEGIGRPFNVAHDFHVSPHLDNLPPEWIAQLQAQGMTEADLMLITSATRQRRSPGDDSAPELIDTASPSRELHTTTMPASELSRTRTPDRKDVVNPRTSPLRSSPAHRMPALMHLDDRRPSLEPERTEAYPAPPQSCSGPSTSANPALGPPSAYDPRASPSKNKRLSEQLRGFAALNLDHVGSWADDLLGLVDGNAKHETRIGSKVDAVDEGQVLRIDPSRVGVLDGRSSASSPRSPLLPRSPKSPCSPGTTKRVPAPPAPPVKDEPVELGAKFTPADRPDEAPSATNSRGSLAHGPPPLPKSHSHSQSLSTAEEHELRTPSTSENGRLPVHLLTTLAEGKDEMSHAWSRQRKDAWGLGGSHASHRPKSGSLGEAIRLSVHDIPSGDSTSVDHQPYSPPRIPPLRLQVDDGAPYPYDLSIPSPLRPPAHPRVSLPSSANGTDDLSRPLSYTSPASSGISPISHIHQRQLSLSPSSDILDSYANTESDDDEERYSIFGLTPAPTGPHSRDSRGRKQSEGSVFMIPPTAGDRAEAGVLPGENDGPDDTGSAVQSPEPLTAGPIPYTPSPPSPAELPSTPDEPDPAIPGGMSWSSTPFARSQSPRIDDDEGDDTASEVDRLAPLPKPQHSSPGAGSAVSHRNSSRSHRSSGGPHHSGSVTGHGRGQDDRQSIALSTFSGESDSAYRDSVLGRDSMLGARVMTAQKQTLGVHEMARTSVFSLSGYMEEDRGNNGGLGSRN